MPSWPCVPLRQRRHRVLRVVGQHRHDGVDVAGLPRRRVPAATSADRVVPRSERRLLLVGQQPAEGLAGPLQRAVDRRDRGLQQVGDLAGREPEHLAQQQDGALQRRQVLQRGDERELHALPRQDAGLRASGPPSSPTCRRVRLEPRRLGRRVQVGRQLPAAPASRSASGTGSWRSCTATGRIEPRSSNRSRPRHARTSDSCTASSASWTTRASGSSARAARRAADRPDARTRRGHPVRAAASSGASTEGSGSARLMG